MVKEAEENKEADEKRKGDIEVKNKAQTYVDEINQTLNDPKKAGKLDSEQKPSSPKLRDEAQGAIQSNNIDKLREIVGKLEDAAAQAQQAQAIRNKPRPNPNPDQASGSADTSKEGHESPTMWSTPTSPIRRKSNV
jgi:molecular chaperone DnaK